jgi:hypothetical protein
MAAVGWSRSASSVERLAQAVASLRSGRVLDQILGDEFECRAVSTFEGLLEGQHGLRRRHRFITHETGSCVRVELVAGRPAGSGSATAAQLQQP